MITRVAAAGRLRMSVERAVAIMHAAGTGTTLVLISTPLALVSLNTELLSRHTTRHGHLYARGHRGPC
jgi:hypothetical protein